MTNSHSRCNRHHGFSIYSLLSGCSWIVVPIKGSTALFFQSPRCVPVYTSSPVVCPCETGWADLQSAGCPLLPAVTLSTAIHHIRIDSSTVLCWGPCLPWPVSICTDILPGDVLMSYYRHPKLHTDKEHMLSLSENVSFWILLKISFSAVEIPVLWIVQRYTNFLSSLRCFYITVWCAVHGWNLNIPRIK